MRLTKREVISTLKQHGYKLTPQRRAVIRAITAEQDHLNPLAIHSRARENQASIGLVTIYRTLEILTKLNLICRLHGSRICHSYTTSTPEHHHHLICNGCGTVVDFSGYDLSELESILSRENEFRIDDHLLEFFGLCRACQNKDKPT
jgi:Fur family ferric uptake transcriptional regulator